MPDEECVKFPRTSKIGLTNAGRWTLCRFSGLPSAAPFGARGQAFRLPDFRVRRVRLPVRQFHGLELREVVDFPFKLDETPANSWKERLLSEGGVCGGPNPRYPVLCVRVCMAYLRLIVPTAGMRGRVESCTGVPRRPQLFQREKSGVTVAGFPPTPLRQGSVSRLFHFRAGVMHEVAF